MGLIDIRLHRHSDEGRISFVALHPWLTRHGRRLPEPLRARGTAERKRCLGVARFDLEGVARPRIVQQMVSCGRKEILRSSG